MLTVIEVFENLYNYLIYECADPRTKDYFLVENPLTVIFISIMYVYFSKNLGPKIMQNRKPFQLNKVMIIYNLLQIVINAFIFFEAYRISWGWGAKYKMICEPVDFSLSPDAIYITRLVHLFYMTKLLDLFDTIFMVLQKKNHRISFLHVYHHAGMFALLWGATKYYPGGHGTFLGFVNSLVHVLMYSYYLLTIVLSSNERNLIRTKKYLTLLQMAQFVICGIHYTLPLFQSNCDYPRHIAAFIIVPQSVFMTILFCDFYRKTYNEDHRINFQEDKQLLTKHKLNYNKS